jgi:hypothetical protein
MRAIEYFSRYNEVDLYGKGWDKPSIRVGRTHVPYTLRRLEYYLKRKWDKVSPDPLLVAARKAYRGQAKSKSQTLAHYKFALCFENAKLPGWITEKIFDCFFAGAITRGTLLTLLWIWASPVTVILLLRFKDLLVPRRRRSAGLHLDRVREKISKILEV